MTSLARRQAALVAALVAGAATPDGFAADRVAAARAALLRKRAGEVARSWPVLAAAHGPGWTATFAAWAAGRPPRGSLRDGWDLARDLAAGPGAGQGPGVSSRAPQAQPARPGLPAPAARELAVREAGWRYDGRTDPRRRRLPAVRRAPDAVVVQVFGRIRTFARRRGG